MKKYRIVTDRYAGYAAEVWCLWWSFWVEIGGCNTFRTVEQAEWFIRRCGSEVVKYVEL